MATDTNAARHWGKPSGHHDVPSGHHDVAVTFDPSLFRVTHVAARDAGIKQATRRRRKAGGANSDRHGTAQNAKLPAGFFVGPYPERF
jgi:hypothetical protein